MFSSFIPHFYWGEVVLKASYIINQSPSKVHQFRNSLNVHLTDYPHVQILTSLPPKVLGQSAYVHDHNPHCHKLQHKVLKCIFFGHSPTQQGYKCNYSSTLEFLVTSIVFFIEDIPYYPNTPLQREKASEESH